MGRNNPTNLEVVAFYAIREINTLPPKDAYLAMIDLLSLVDEEWITALFHVYIKKHKWDKYVQEVPTARIPAVPKKGQFSPSIHKWTLHPL
jgi:hypothetical protein